MIRTILAISGRPGLYKLISQGKNMLIVETVDASKKRLPIYGRDQVTSLGDISMYTDSEDVPLAEVLESVKAKEKGLAASIDPKKVSKEDLRAYFAEILPEFDRDRVHDSDIKKLISWYNMLISNGITEFVEKKDEEKTAEKPTKKATENIAKKSDKKPAKKAVEKPAKKTEVKKAPTKAPAKKIEKMKTGNK